MKIYRVCQDSRFSRLVPTDWLGTAARFPGGPIGNDWKPFAVEFCSRKEGHFDLQWLLGASTVLFRAAVCDRLAAVLRQGEIELLPFPTPYGEFMLGNVINVVNCLDREKTVFRPNAKVIEYYVFRPQAVRGALFKVPDDPSSIFVPEYTGDPATEFKAAVQYHGLTGIKFDLLWESEA